MDKVISTLETVKNLNPEINVRAIKAKLEGETLENEVQAADIVLDCSDNFTTRFSINAACVKLKKPLVSGAAIRFEGQVSVFNSRENNSPCYNCLYQQEGEELQTCSTNGVIAPITGIVGSIQALEAMKLIIGIGDSLIGRLLVIDGLTMEFTTLKLRRNPHCPTCRNS
jgi:adenylyltransferase/sulfurtransferase